MRSIYIIEWKNNEGGWEPCLDEPVYIKQSKAEAAAERFNGGAIEYRAAEYAPVRHC